MYTLFYTKLPFEVAIIKEKKQPQMILNDPFFIGICFFSIGFLSLVGFAGVYLNFFFKSKIYKYYSLYVLSLLLFVVTVYIKDTGDFPFKSERRNVMQLVVDGLQVLSALFFCAFIYYAMILQDIKYTKLKKAYNFFIGFTIFYFVILFLFPDFVRLSYSFFIVSRAIIYLISIVFYYNICRQLNIVFFRYLFFAITFLFVSGFMALWDSTVNSDTSIYTGFHYLCIGYFLENSCFMGAFIYRYFIVEKEKKDIEHQHEVQLFTSKIEMQQQTMEHLGKEIHDNIGQKLTLASLYTQQLDHENKAPNVKDTITNISTLLNETLSEMRELTKSLTLNAIENSSIATLIENECERVKKLKIFSVKFFCENKKINLSYEVKTIMIRIVQEFFQNSIKHAKCSNITIKFAKVKSEVVLILEDNGNGFDTENYYSAGFGLKNMKERTEMLNGKFQLESKMNLGTKITILLPI